MFLLYRIRHFLSWLVALAALGAIYEVNKQPPLKIQPHYDQTTMELSLAAPEPVAQPVPVEPPPPPPEEPPPPPEEPPVAAEEPTPPPPKPKPKPKPEVKKPEPVKKVAAVKRAATVKPAEPAPAPVPPKPAPAAAKPATPQSQVNSAGQENGYQQALRGQLEATKRYPTGRQAALERPQGSVEVWLEVDRSGRVLGSGISKRATSMLLNRAALSSLQALTQVKPFPAEAYVGQNTKRFSATFTYEAP